MDFMKDGASFIEGLGLSKEMTDILTRGLQNAATSTVGAVLSGDNAGEAFVKGFTTGGVNGAVSGLMSNIDGFGDLTAAQQKMITNLVTGIVSDKPLDQLVINAAIAAATEEINKAKGTDTKGTDTKVTTDTKTTTDTVTGATGNDTVTGATTTDTVTGATGNDVTTSNLATKDVVSSVGTGATATDALNLGGTDALVASLTGDNAVINQAVTNDKLNTIASTPKFTDAFAQARELLGPGKTFTWQGKEYSTATAAERPDLSTKSIDALNAANLATTTDASRTVAAQTDTTARAAAATETLTNIANSTKATTPVTYSGPTVLGVPIGTVDDSIRTIKRMGDVVMDTSRGLGQGFGNFATFFGDLGNILTTTADDKAGTTSSLISKDNLLSTVGRDVANYYKGLTTEETKQQTKNFISDVKNAPDYLKPFVAITSGIQNIGGLINMTAVELGEEGPAFALGFAASIDFSRTNGRATFAFKAQDGVTATVTDEQITANLLDNGYSFYGSYATANDQFNFAYNGQMAGKFKWFDTFLNQVYLNSQLQLALMSLLTSVKSIPYNESGYSLIRAAMQDPIDSALNFGGIRKGITLSASQAAQVNSAAGLDVSDIIEAQGYYLQILDPGAQVRANRGTPVINFWYTDGGAVQKITLASIDIL